MSLSIDEAVFAVACAVCCVLLAVCCAAESVALGALAAAVVAHYRGRYDPKLDRGGDVADAIGIARWWIGRTQRGFER
jgi:hypothetical protein